MEQLSPYTIYNSINTNPSVLITDKMERFVFVQPLNPSFILAQNLYTLLHNHFKVSCLEAGTFTLKGTKYICAKEQDGVLEVDEWIGYVWTTKRKFNRLLNPSALFRMFLINLYFPIFQDSRKLVVLGKKDRFIADAYPVLSNEKDIFFREISLNKLGLSKVEFKALFRYMKSDLIKIWEDFKALHHENLYSDVKYQVSLYSAIRNQHWKEISYCFSKEYTTLADAQVEHYILNL